MSDEVSLFALMDSHLSNTKLDDGNRPSSSISGMLFPTPPGPRLVIPNFFPGNSPIKDFIAEQISNTLKANEKRKQEEEEQRKLEEELKSLKLMEKQQLVTVDSPEKMNLCDEEEYVIDLTAAIIKQPKPIPCSNQPIVPHETSIKNQKAKLVQGQDHSDLPLRWDKETCLYKSWNPNLPCTTDISCILKQKIKKGKCSNFGKVLCSRVLPLRHIAIPYKIEKFDSNIVRFDFNTKSPGDIFKENEQKQRKPKMSTRWTVDILDYI